MKTALLLIGFLWPRSVYAAQTGASMQRWAPYLLGILLTLGFIFIVVSIFIPKSKWSKAIVVASFIAYFFISSVTLEGGALPPILFTAGLMLLFVELLIPGFGFPGIAGIVLVLAGSYAAIGDAGLAFATITVALLSAVVAAWIFLKMGFKYTAFSKFALETEFTKEQGFTSSESKEGYLGKEGIAETILRPSGTISVEGEKLSAITQGEFIPKDTPVEIIRVEGGKIIVRRK